MDNLFIFQTHINNRQGRVTFKCLLLFGLLLTTILKPLGLRADTSVCPDSLYQQAQIDILSPDQKVRARATEAFLALSGDTSASPEIRRDATIIYGNMCVNEGNISGLNVALQRLSGFLDNDSMNSDLAATIKELEECLEALQKENRPFAERICGLWVSGERSWYTHAPIFAVEISYNDSTREYMAKIDEASYFYKFFKNAHKSNDISIMSGKRRAQVYFGTEKRKKGGNMFTESLIRSKVNHLNTLSATKSKSAGHAVSQLTSFGQDALALAMLSMFGQSKEEVYLCNMVFEEDSLISGWANVSLDFQYHLKTSKGKQTDYEGTRKLSFFKVEESDSLAFRNSLTKSKFMALSRDEAPNYPKSRKYSKSEDLLYNNESARRLASKFIGRLNNLSPDVRTKPGYKELENEIRYCLVDTSNYPSGRFKYLYPYSQNDNMFSYFTGLAHTSNRRTSWPIEASLTSVIFAYIFMPDSIYGFIPKYGELRLSCDPEENPYYIGEFKDGLPHGNGKWFYSDGAIYEGRFKKGKRHGKGKITMPDGCRYEGNWKEDLRHGKGESFDAATGISRKEEWKKGAFVKTLKK